MSITYREYADHLEVDLKHKDKRTRIKVTKGSSELIERYMSYPTQNLDNDLSRILMDRDVYESEAVRKLYSKAFKSPYYEEADNGKFISKFEFWKLGQMYSRVFGVSRTPRRDLFKELDNLVLAEDDEQWSALKVVMSLSIAEWYGEEMPHPLDAEPAIRMIIKTVSEHMYNTLEEML